MAYKSSSKFRLGAVLAKKNRVVSTGYNNMGKSHPLQQKYAKNVNFTLGLHAEVASCLGIPMLDIKDATLYVVRLLKDNKTALAKPCSTCQNFIYNVGIKKVIYSDEFDSFKNMDFR